MRGIHHKLGVVLPANNSVLEPELWPHLPVDAALHTARILVRGDLTPQTIEAMEAEVGRAVDELVATGVGLVAYADMVTTFIMPNGWNCERSSEIEHSSGLPCISAWTAMERALSVIGARRLAVGGPYPAAIHARAVAYFRKAGFDVVADATLDVLSVRAVPEVSRESVIALAGSIARPEADAIVLLATDLPTFDAIEAIEASIGRPVLSCNQTILWAMLAQRGIAISGPGRLFDHQPRDGSPMTAVSSKLIRPREFSRRADAMPRSAIREIMALAATRADVIHLEVGEPDFCTPEHIITAAFAAVRAGATKYTGNAGRMQLRERIAARVRGRTQQSVVADQVIVTVGAIGALYTALMSVLDAGEEVLIPDPGWPNYEAIAVLAGARPVRYPLTAHNGFVPDPDEIACRIGARTKAVLLNSPGNPTGAVFPAEIVAAIGALAERTGVHIVSDEIYEDIVFDGRRHVSFLDHTPTDRVFVIGGASKSYAMTGWRLGWLICPRAAATLASKLQEPVVSCAPSPSQAAAEAALAGTQAVVEVGRRLFERRRDLFLEILGATGAIAARPGGAFYGLVRIGNEAESALVFAKRLLVEGGVAVVPGDTFGASTARMVRLAFTVDDADLRAGLERLRAFLRR